MTRLPHESHLSSFAPRSPPAYHAGSSSPLIPLIPLGFRRLRRWHPKGYADQLIARTAELDQHNLERELEPADKEVARGKKRQNARIKDSPGLEIEQWFAIPRGMRAHGPRGTSLGP
jgi:hypothetical protein